MAKQNDFTRNQIILTSSAVLMIGLNALILRSFDLISALIYVALASLIGSFIGDSKQSSAKFLLFGALLSLAYNLSFSFIGMFSVASSFVVLAAIQQALLGFVSAEIIGGGKK